MNSFLRYVFHRFLPDPVPGEVWVYDDGDPFSHQPMTITAVKDGWCQYYLTNYATLGLRHSKNLQRLKAFYRKQNP